MLAELAIGRSAQREATGAFASLGGSPRWRLAGYPSVLAAFVVLAYYPVIAAFLIERYRMPRARAALVAAATAFAAGIPAALSFGLLGEVRPWGRGVLDTMDHFVSNLLLPLNGILIALFVGWVWRASEARAASGLGPQLAAWWQRSLRYVAPVLIGVILLHSLGLFGAG